MVNDNLVKVYNSTIVTKSSKDFSFNIHMNENLFSLENNLLYDTCRGKKLLVVISETVNQLYSEEIYKYFNYNFPENAVKIITIKTTEENKNMENVLSICKAGKEFGLDRRAFMIGIGGGILLDMVGFAASMYKRKLNYIRIPTTLVGQIDAGIGIKTSVNFRQSKNFIGSYHPPFAVFNDISLLTTLHPEELKCGLAEIIKMGIIVDKELFERIESDKNTLAKQCNEVNKNSYQKINHMAIVDMLNQLVVNFYEDDLERLVDFGHTFSPFIEEFTNYEVKHGLAVAMDIAISTEISYLLGKIDQSSKDRILNLILDLGMDIYDSSIYHTDLIDKSLDNVVLHRGNNLNLVIPTQIGEAVFIKDKETISKKLLKQACENLEVYQDEFNSKRSLLSI